jgi:hypothetical protein
MGLLSFLSGATDRPTQAHALPGALARGVPLCRGTTASARWAHTRWSSSSFVVDEAQQTWRKSRAWFSLTKPSHLGPINAWTSIASPRHRPPDFLPTAYRASAPAPIHGEIYHRSHGWLRLEYSARTDATWGLCDAAATKTLSFCGGHGNRWRLRLLAMASAWRLNRHRGHRWVWACASSLHPGRERLWWCTSPWEILFLRQFLPMNFWRLVNCTPDFELHHRTAPPRTLTRAAATGANPMRWCWHPGIGSGGFVDGCGGFWCGWLDIWSAGARGIARRYVFWRRDAAVCRGRISLPPSIEGKPSPLVRVRVR